MRHLGYPHVLCAPNDSPYGTAPPPQVPRPPAPTSDLPRDPGPGQPVAPPASPTGDGTPPAPSIGPEALQSALTQALSPLQTELAQLREENAQLRDGLQASQQRPPESSGGDDDFTRALLQNPKEAIGGVVKEVMSGLAPYWRELGGTAHDGIVEGQRAAFDAEFGEGAFQEEIMPILSKRFEVASKENPALLASREWINSEVAAAKGFKMSQLFDRRTKAAEARTEAERKEAERIFSHLNATNLSGGIRPSPDGKPREPTPDEKAYLDARARAGVPRDLETLRKSASSGSSLTELEAAFKPEQQPGRSQ